MNRLVIGGSLSARLHAAEAAVDQAMADAAGLAAALPVARLDAALSAVAGHRAFEEAAASVAALAAARTHLVRTHQVLAALARRLGMDVLAVGQLDKPGDRPPVSGGGDGDDSPAARASVNETCENNPNKSLPGCLQMC